MLRAIMLRHGNIIKRISLIRENTGSQDRYFLYEKTEKKCIIKKNIEINKTKWKFISSLLVKGISHVREIALFINVCHTVGRK